MFRCMGGGGGGSPECLDVWGVGGGELSPFHSL